jgi:hypothetical protein
MVQAFKGQQPAEDGMADEEYGLAKRPATGPQGGGADRALDAADACSELGAVASRARKGIGMSGQGAELVSAPSLGTVPVLFCPHRSQRLFLANGSFLSSWGCICTEAVILWHHLGHPYSAGCGEAKLAGAGCIMLARRMCAPCWWGNP